MLRTRARALSLSLSHTHTLSHTHRTATCQKSEREKHTQTPRGGSHSGTHLPPNCRKKILKSQCSRTMHPIKSPILMISENYCPYRMDTFARANSLWRTHSMENTFYGKHILWRAHYMENKFYGEKILWRTHSSPYRGRTGSPMYAHIPRRTHSRDTTFYGGHILQTTHSCPYRGRTGSPRHVQSRGPRAALLISPPLQEQILKSQYTETL